MASHEKMSAAAQRIIDHHLDAIEVSLRASGMTRSERLSTLEDVENQIHEMLEQRTAGDPQEGEVRAVIAELDPPESYVSSLDSTVAGSAPSEAIRPLPSPRHLSKSAVIGAFWAIPFLVGVPLFFLLVGSGYASRIMEYVPRMWMGASGWVFIKILWALAAITAPFGTTLLGIIAISQIRHSRGRLYGRGLALGTALLFPLLATLPLCLAITDIAYVFLNRPNEIFDPSYNHHFTELLSAPQARLLAALLWVLVACVVTRWTWRRSGRPLPNESRLSL